ncbi:hypothetical protein ACFSM5_16785 [Lacibacterium aquatile]|uniref:Glycosyltransferase n=1 Tax=Lacibacterium aquatile TaxID=1168082 RepID=A0ABW5DVQ3_9PROT
MDRSVVMLVDGPIGQDRRVLSAIDAYRDLGYAVQVIDVLDGRRRPSLRAWVMAACAVIKALPGLPRFFRATKRHRALAYRPWRLGVALHQTCLETLSMVARGLELRQTVAGASLVHANDLKALIVAWAGGATNILYDSHELNLFMNRRGVQLPRIFLNFALESVSWKRVRNVITISPPIRDFLLDAYGDKPLAVVENDFYRSAADIEARCEESGAEPLEFLFFGSFNTGRGIGHLVRLLQLVPEVRGRLVLMGDEALNRQRLHKAFPQGVPSNLLVTFDVTDTSGYIASLPPGRRYGWVCNEDICLSYRYSLPNKFFQSVRLGLPMVAMAETYLGTLVTDNRLGRILRADDLDSADSARAFVDALEAGFAQGNAAAEAFEPRTTGYRTALDRLLKP